MASDDALDSDAITRLEFAVSNLTMETSNEEQARGQESINKDTVRSWLQGQTESAETTNTQFEGLYRSVTRVRDGADKNVRIEGAITGAFGLMQDEVESHFQQPFPPKSRVFVPLSDRIRLVEARNVVNFLLDSWFTPKREIEDFQNPPDTLQLLHYDFMKTYRGSGDQWLFEALEQYKEKYLSTTHYGKVISFIQSSGAGKTRTLEQLGLKLAFVGACMRGIKKRMLNNNAGLDVRYGWPRGDEPVFEYFALGSKYKGEELACAFLAGLFETIAEVAERSTDLQKFRTEWAVSGEPSTRTTSRYKNFKAAVKRAEDLLLRHGGELASFRPTAEEKALVAAWVDQINTLLIKPLEAKIQRVIDRFNSSLVIGIDECTELNVAASPPTEIAPNGPSLLALRRAIKSCENLDVWFILVDTSSGLLETHPATGELAPSSRLRKDLIPFRPYHCLEWDTQFLPEDLPDTPQQALAFGHLKLYGRPYWAAVPDPEVLDVARRKLLYTDKHFDPKNLHQVLAVFASRVLLELGSESSQMAVELVQRHMRIFTGLRHNDVVTTQVPSEPILAAAAASCLLPDRDVYRMATKTLIRELIINDCVVERGVRGELHARILLMLARDQAEMTTQGTWTLKAWEHGVQPVNLAKLLKALLGEGLSETHDVLKWAEGYFVNFTHFYQATEELSNLSPEFLRQCWSRGVAVACTHNQPNYDIFIVAYGGDLSKDFDASKWAIVVIQVKMRENPALPAIIAGLTCPTVTDSETGAKKKPQHLAILMDLGTDKQFLGQKGNRCMLHPKQRASMDLASTSEPERYVIHVRGCKSDSYPVIEQLAPELPALDLREVVSLGCHEPMMRSIAPMTLETVKERGDGHKESKKRSPADTIPEQQSEILPTGHWPKAAPE